MYLPVLEQKSDEIVTKILCCNQLFENLDIWPLGNQIVVVWSPCNEIFVNCIPPDFRAVHTLSDMFKFREFHTSNL